MDIEELRSALDLIALAEVRLQRQEGFDDDIVTAPSALRLAGVSVQSAAQPSGISLVAQVS
jgi:hypothetical protein